MKFLSSKQFPLPQQFQCFFFHFHLQCFLLSNAENDEHLRNFRNADCEVTIHNKDQDMQASLKTTN